MAIATSFDQISLLQLGKGPETTSFADEFVRVGGLKKKEMLDEDTFEKLLPEMDKNAILLIESGATLGALQEELLKITKEMDMVIIMKDCKAGDLQCYAAVCSSGKYVAVKNTSQGHRQQVMVINDDVTFDVVEVEEVAVIEQPPSDENKERSSDEEPASESEDEYVQPTGVVQELLYFATSVSEDTSGDTSPSKELYEAAAAFEDMWKGCTSESAHKKHEEESRPATLTGGGNRIVADGSNREEEIKWFHHTTLQVRCSPGRPEVESKPKYSKGIISCSCTVDVKLGSTSVHDHIKFEFKGVKMYSQMGLDDIFTKGFFNESAHVQIFPGNGEEYPALPSGWDFNVEPCAENCKTVFTDGNQVDLGVTVGANSGPHGAVTGLIRRNHQEQYTLPDFSFRQDSRGSVSGVVCYYTATFENKWKDHFTTTYQVKPIADLAKSTLDFKGSSEYYGPPTDDSAIKDWNLRFTPTFALLCTSFAARKCIRISPKLDPVKTTINFENFRRKPEGFISTVLSYFSSHN